MEEYRDLYEKLDKEFQSYQSFAEERLQKLNDTNRNLEKNLGIFTNIIEMAKYINSYIFDDNLIDKINDTIVGMLGVSYSTIHILNGFSLEPKATNFSELEVTRVHYELGLLKERKAFIVNKGENIFGNNRDRGDIRSLIAVPIGINDGFIGYIVVEHKYFSFFHTEDVKFLEYIAHQVAMAITNRNLYSRIEEAAKKDALLDIYNRKYFYDFIGKKVKRESKEGFSIIMADLDNFKKVNDNYGHQVGDYALKHITNIISYNLSSKDVMARYGGEEIIIFINKENNRDKVVEKVEKLRSDIERFPLILVDGRKINITMSFGISYIEKIEENINIDDIIKKADDNLYKAKRLGKNRVEI